MTCETCMEKLIALDNGERVPLLVFFHLVRCTECEKVWAQMNTVYSSLQDSIDGCDVDLVDTVMGHLHEGYSEENARGGVSLKIWLGVGFLLLAAMIFSALAEPFAMARTSPGDLILMPISLTFGIVLSVYLVFFILSHMAWLLRFTRIAGFGHR